MTGDQMSGRLPEEAVRMLVPKLKPSFEKMYERLGPGQAFVQFISDLPPSSNSVTLQHPPSDLWLNEQKVRLEVLRPDGVIGLTRWAALNDKIIIYPTDEDSREIYANADERVQTEIVGPIHFRGKVTGVVLYDCTDKGRIYGEDERSAFYDFLHHIDKEIYDSVERPTEELKVAAELNEIINNCYKVTYSARGYIAVKRWDGVLEYFKAGEETERFLDLAPHEGLCGKVLRTGKMVYVKEKLFSETHYIPSDTEVQSEIVYPIKHESETIGVINLESKTPHAYDDEAVEKLLEEKAKQAAPSAKFYRAPSDPEVGLAIADLYHTSLWIRPPESRNQLEDDIRATLRKWLVKLLKAKRVTIWLPQDRARPPSLPDVKWEDAIKGLTVASPTPPGKTIIVPVLMQGEPLFVVALDLWGEGKPQDQKTMKALCGIASEFLRRCRYEYRIRCFINLIDDLISRPRSEVMIERAVRDTRFILQSNHCTLFYLLRLDGKELFVPGPSTAEATHIKGHYPGYLPKLHDGLTGFVAQTGRPLRIDDVSDKSELEEKDKDLVWKSRISEEVEWDCRSFLAYPIFDPSDSAKVIGVIRTHRDAKSHQSGFTSEDDGMFKTISYLLSPPLSTFLENKT
jgi:putative methionine-R-sulfoxide reductase with GAF domain